MQLKNSRIMSELFRELGRTPVLLYPEHALNEAANNALLLEEKEQEIAAAKRYSVEDILYARYYWYTKCLFLCEALYGKNAGMEQGQFKIIEAMDREGILDGEKLEEMERELRL